MMSGALSGDALSGDVRVLWAGSNSPDVRDYDEAWREERNSKRSCPGRSMQE